MRICHVITRLIVGGAQENTVSTCIGLRKLGHEVDLVIGPQTGPEGSLYDQAKAAGVPIIVVDELRRAPNPWLDVSACRALRSLFVSKRYEVVHTHSGKAGFGGTHRGEVGACADHRAHDSRPVVLPLPESGGELGVSLGGTDCRRVHDAICVGCGRDDGAIPRGGDRDAGSVRDDPQRDEHRRVSGGARVTIRCANRSAFRRTTWWSARLRGCFG